MSHVAGHVLFEELGRREIAKTDADELAKLSKEALGEQLGAIRAPTAIADIGASLSGIRAQPVGSIASFAGLTPANVTAANTTALRRASGVRADIAQRSGLEGVATNRAGQLANIQRVLGIEQRSIEQAPFNLVSAAAQASIGAQQAIANPQLMRQAREQADLSIQQARIDILQAPDEFAFEQIESMLKEAQTDKIRAELDDPQGGTDALARLRFGLAFGVDRRMNQLFPKSTNIVDGQVILNANASPEAQAAFGVLNQVVIDGEVAGLAPVDVLDQVVNTEVAGARPLGSRRIDAAGGTVQQFTAPPTSIDPVEAAAVQSIRNAIINKPDVTAAEIIAEFAAIGQEVDAELVRSTLEGSR